MDKLSKEARSALMGKVRSRGNRSTEVRLRLALVRAGIDGWKLHPKSITGQPDFWFPRNSLAIFVDGCFWHGCRRCLRLPHGNRSYWRAKIQKNVQRAKFINCELRSAGVIVLRVWEHQMKDRDGVEKFIDVLFDKLRPSTLCSRGCPPFNIPWEAGTSSPSDPLQL